MVNKPLSKPPLKRGLLFLFFVGWIIAILLGCYFVWNYGSKPGAVSDTLREWPASSELSLNREKPTLLMFLHPRCPCSRTSLDELDALLLERAKDFETTIAFVIPSGEGEDWSGTALRKKVGALAGIRVFDDHGGKAASLFGAKISGETFMFHPEGKLLFHGGITGARGHAGDNKGRRILSEWSPESQEDLQSTPVFGCSLDGLCDPPPLPPQPPPPAP